MNYREVCLAQNRRIVSESLAKLTWGNYSIIDRSNNLVYIKPTGIDLSSCSVEQIAVVDLDCHRVDGLKPSVDTKIHLELYKQFLDISSICHTHSPYAVAYAQAGMHIEVLGTTHADISRNAIKNIPVPEELFSLEADHEFELGKLIASSLSTDDAAVLLRSHGPFVWSKNLDAVDVAIAIEEVAKMAFLTRQLSTDNYTTNSLREFHWNRKHGSKRSYGQ